MKNIVLYLLCLLSINVSQMVMADKKADNTRDVVVKVGDNEITSDDVERVLISSPFADNFAVMDEKAQAGIRGNILLRLINLNVLLLEAKALKLDQQSEFLIDLNRHRKSIVYKKHMDELRQRVEVPRAVVDDLVRRMQGNTEALEAAIAQYKVKYYKQEKQNNLAAIKQQLGLEVFTDKLTKGIHEDEVLAKTHDGYTLKFQDLNLSNDDKEWFYKPDIIKRLFDHLEIDLINRVALQSEQQRLEILRAFERDRLPALLLMMKEREWVPDSASAKQYLAEHPKIAYQLEQRLLAQIVVASEGAALQVLNRLNSGISFFELARQFSIDRVGRKNAGQLGWLKEGTGMPEIEAVLKRLQIGQVSNIIKTDSGYHLVYLMDRKPGIYKRYEEIADQVQQAIIQDKMPKYLSKLRKKYPITFVQTVSEKKVYQ